MAILDLQSALKHQQHFFLLIHLIDINIDRYNVKNIEYRFVSIRIISYRGEFWSIENNQIVKKSILYRIVMKAPIYTPTRQAMVVI